MIFTSLRRLPGGLIGMLVMVVCVDAFIVRNEKNFRHPWGWDWFLADRAASAARNGT